MYPILFFLTTILIFIFTENGIIDKQLNVVAWLCIILGIISFYI